IRQLFPQSLRNFACNLQLLYIQNLEKISTYEILHDELFLRGKRRFFKMGDFELQSGRLCSSKWATFKVRFGSLDFRDVLGGFKKCIFSLTF
ncbi:MAG: hypothetical protein Q4F99_03780, partial [bacterium]|nr:hypothetical protein [bacterium]